MPAPATSLNSLRTFFATTKSSQGRVLLQSGRNATLIFDVLRSYVGAGMLRLHDFVVMPDPLHLLLTVGEDMTIERTMQFVEGGSSYRWKKEQAYLGEVWQRGSPETRVEDGESFVKRKEYIGANPVKAGLTGSREEYPDCFTHLAKRRAAGANALD